MVDQKTMSAVMINLGCGTNQLPAPWRNYDLDLDITNPLPFATDSVDFILIEHCLEHVNSAHGMRFMIEAHRVLKSAGTLRICVPQLIRLSHAKRRDICINHGHEMVYCWENISLMLAAAGFSHVHSTDAKEIDGHWKVIGREADEQETLRVEAIK